MSENPFDALAGGGFDMGALLQQAQQMQEQVMATQEQLSAQVVTGSVAGVSVEVTGLGELSKVEITPGQFDGSSADDLADLGDLVVAAYRDARAKAEAKAAEAMGPLGGAGGLGLPGLG